MGLQMGISRVLIIENKDNGNIDICKMLSTLGHFVKKVSCGIEAIEEINKGRYDLILSDFYLSDINPFEFLQKLKRANITPPIVFMAEKVDVTDAVESIKSGAYDFFMKPVEPEKIIMVLRNIITKKEDSLDERDIELNNPPIITKNPLMKRILNQAKNIADSRASVLIQGESGTGKELLARFIHNNSKRKNKPFVAINCAALPEALIESELFGHEKGSFTGAVKTKKGRFELANTGTILLDEISEMNYSLQSKLLRVIQEKEIERVGGIHPIKIDVRIIATTNRDLKNEIKKGSFREDLYYRLNVIPMHLPPLRERKEDIPLLVDFFIKKYNILDNRNVKGLTEDAMNLLMNMKWKGNVRELENVIERAVLMCEGDLINEGDLLMFDGEKSYEISTEDSFLNTLSLKEIEKKAIFQALDRTNGNRTHAAELLGISVRTLRNKLNEYKKKMAEDSL